MKENWDYRVKLPKTGQSLVILNNVEVFMIKQVWSPMLYKGKKYSFLYGPYIETIVFLNFFTTCFHLLNLIKLTTEWLKLLLKSDHNFCFSSREYNHKAYLKKKKAIE